MVVIIKECVKLNWCSPSLIVCVIMLTPHPHKVGVDILVYCYRRPLWESHQLLRDPLLHWVACFLFPRSLSFDFCYDLVIWAQGQALRAFFCCCYVFFHHFIKSMMGISIKLGRKLHRHLVHDPIIVDL